MTHFTVLKRLAVAALLAIGLGGTAAAQDNSGAVMGELTLGSKDAPVTIVEYASMTCPHCARFHNETFKDLKAKYIDTGKVYFIYREFPLDRVAFAVAIAARCVGEKRYFPMLSLLFKNQERWATARPPMAAVAKLMRLGGVGQKRLDACLKNRDLGDVVLANRQKGEKENVRSTPSFLINGQMLAGAFPLSRFDEIIASKASE